MIPRAYKVYTPITEQSVKVPLVSMYSKTPILAKENMHKCETSVGKTYLKCAMIMSR